MTISLKWVGFEDFYHDSLTWGEALDSLLAEFYAELWVFEDFEESTDSMELCERLLHEDVYFFRAHELCGARKFLAEASTSELLIYPQSIASTILSFYICELGVPFSEVDGVDLRPVGEELANYTAFSDFKLPLDVLLSFKSDLSSGSVTFEFINKLYCLSDKRRLLFSYGTTLMDSEIELFGEMQLTARKILSLLLVKAFHDNYDNFRYQLLTDGLEVLRDKPLIYI